MVNEILMDAFHDELEKIAGLPRAVQQGGGGYIGRLMREKAAPGKEIAREMAGYRKDLDRHFRRKIPGRHLNPAEPLPKSDAYNRYRTRNQPDPQLGDNLVSEVDLRKMNLKNVLVESGIDRLGGFARSKRNLAGLGDPKVTRLRPEFSDGARRKGKVTTFPTSRSAAVPKPSRRERIKALRQQIDDRDRQFTDDLFVDIDDIF
jgi:hypothetical protein